MFFAVILFRIDDPAKNVDEVSGDFACHNGHCGTRQGVVFLVNGILVLVIECKKATKDDGIALGIDQTARRRCGS